MPFTLVVASGTKAKTSCLRGIFCQTESLVPGLTTDEAGPLLAIQRYRRSSVKTMSFFE